MADPNERSADGPTLDAIRAALGGPNGPARLSRAGPCPACGRPVVEGTLRIHGQPFHRSCVVDESAQEDDAA